MYQQKLARKQQESIGPIHFFERIMRNPDGNVEKRLEQKTQAKNIKNLLAHSEISEVLDNEESINYLYAGEGMLLS